MAIVSTPLNKEGWLPHFIVRKGLLLSLICFGLYTTCHAQWKRAVSNTSSSLKDVGYSNGLWVAVGSSGGIVTSPDGINWTPRTSGTSQPLRAVSYGGSQWMVIGKSGTILTSPNGITWSPQSTTITQDNYDVAYGAGQWVITGPEGIFTSSDGGVTWIKTMSSPGSSSSTGSPFAFQSVSYGAGVFVVVADNIAIYSSPDGITWTARSAAIPGSGLCHCFYPTLYASAFGDGKFVVIGGYAGGGAVATSPDGITWKVGSGVQQSFDVNYGAGLWFSISFYGNVQTSTNGLTWSIQTNNNIYKRILETASYGAGQWVGVGNNGEIQYSTNANSPLPVSLVSFNGRPEENSAQLTWETAWEKGSSHFLVERSSNAQSFEVVGRVDAQNTTDVNHHYTFIDNYLTSGIWYYRLREVDLDDTFTYSSIIAIRIGIDPLSELTLLPNPGLGPLTLEYKNGLKQVQIYSITGVLIEEYNFTQSVDQYSWASTGQPAGLYIIRVETQDGKSSRLRWIKQ